MNFLSIPSEPNPSLPRSGLAVPSRITLAGQEPQPRPRSGGSAAPGAASDTRHPPPPPKNHFFSPLIFQFSSFCGLSEEGTGEDLLSPRQGHTPEGCGPSRGCRCSPAGDAEPGAAGSGGDRRGPEVAGGKRAPPAASPGMPGGPGRARAGQVSLSGARRGPRHWPALSHGLNFVHLTVSRRVPRNRKTRKGRVGAGGGQE